MTRRFTVVAHREQEGEGYYVSVPALPGCFTAGPTPEMALDRVREAIQAHVEALAKSGLPIPDGDTEPVQVASVVIDVAA